MKPGVHKIPMSAYLKADGLAHHDLKHMERTPAHFVAARQAEEEQTRALAIGEIAHTAILEPDLLEKSYWLRPETYENEKGIIKAWNGNSTVCKDWLFAHQDRTIILHSEHDAIIAMRKAVMEHPAAREALKKGDRELSMFAHDPDTHVLLKSRPDWTSGNTLVNLKTTEDASPAGFAKSVAKFGYDSAAAFHLDVANFLELKKEFYLFIAVEKSEPYAVAVYQLDEASIDLGRSKYRRWLSLYSHCAQLDEWPAYDPAIVRLSLPEWTFRQEERLLLNA